MANNDDIKGGPHEMHCAFCGKSRSQVDKLIQGPNGICICDECISTAAEMLSGTPYAIDYDDEPVSGKVTFSRAGRHTLEARFTTVAGRRKIVELEITVE